MIATLEAMRGGKIPPERVPAVLGTVSAVVNSFILDHEAIKK